MFDHCKADDVVKDAGCTGQAGNTYQTHDFSWNGWPQCQKSIVEKLNQIKREKDVSHW